MRAHRPKEPDEGLGDGRVKPPNVISMPDRGVIEQEAAVWVTRLDGAEVSEDDRRAFSEWYRTSSAHKSAFDRMAGLWGGLDIISEFGDHARNVIVTEAVEDDRVASRRVLFRQAVLLGMLLSALLALGAAGITWVADEVLPHEPYRPDAAAAGKSKTDTMVVFDPSVGGNGMLRSVGEHHKDDAEKAQD